MIHEAFTISEIARRYYKLKTGEDILKEVARSRWRMTRNPDLKILNKVIDIIYKEQKEKLR